MRANPVNEEEMKKFILHCNIYTVATRFFNLNFVCIQKEVTLAGTNTAFKRGLSMYAREEKLNNTVE